MWDNTDAILGGQAIVFVNAAVLGGALGAKRIGSPPPKVMNITAA